jgi:mono/diheme cytochrome c family protein
MFTLVNMRPTRRRVLKIAGILLAGILAVSGILVLYVQLAGLPRYAVEPIEFRAPATPQRLARGKKLANILCVGCHVDPRTGRLSGHHLVDVPSKFGSVYSANITRHPSKGIGSWTDGDIAYLLRTGVARDGRYIPPWMVKLPHMADEDLRAVVSFLRSDDPLVAPANVEPPGESRPSLLTKLLCRVAFEKLPYPRKPIEAPPISDKVAHGRYLVMALDCFGCHSAAWETVNIATPERSAGYLGGGNSLLDLRGKPIYSANITFDEATGIGQWSEQDLGRALRQGFRPDGAVLRNPMAPMPELDDDEIGALYAYLRTVPKLRNSVPRQREVDELAANTSQGRRLYYRYACVSCHGEGGGGGNADIRRAETHFPTRAELRAWIRDAQSVRPGTRMPSFKGVIPEEEYDPLIAYVLELGKRR